MTGWQENRAGTTVRCPPSHTASSSQTMPPHQRLYSPWTQLAPGLRWTPRPWLDSCPRTGLRGARWASVTCTFVHITIGFFEPGNPRPGALLDFLCLYKTCQAGYAVFLPLFFQTLLKYQDIRKQTKNRVFSPQSQRHTKAFIGHRLCWRPAAVLLSGGVCF